MTAAPLTHHALAYAAAGWAVHPLRPKDKTPASAHGSKDATDDVEQIQRWWQAMPFANIGIGTGDGFFVVDLDGAAAALWAEANDLPPTLTAKTARGKHFYFAIPPGVTVRNSTSDVADGVDIRGIGGYVVAAPSVHPSGAVYQWIDLDQDAPSRELMAQAPEWLLALVAAPTAPTAANPSQRFTLPPTIRKGKQHETLWKYACSLWARGKGKEEVFQAVLAASKTCQEVPPEKNVRRIADYITGRYPPGRSKTTTTPTTSPTTPTATTTRSPFEADDGGSGGAVADTPTGAIRYSLNLHDTGNADRLVSAYGDKLLFCESRASFGVWTGAYWRLEKGLTVARIAEQVIRDEFAKAGKITDSEVRKTFIAHLNKSLSRSGIESMVEVSKRKVRTVDPADFDATPHLLNFDNGTLDLRSGVLKAHDPNDLITRCIPYEYDTAAECPTFHRFLQRIMGFRAGGDSEQNDRALRLIGYLRRLFGCALGGKPEKIVAILHGNGNNGKTTLLETIRAVLGGRQYAGQIQIESLMVKPGDASASNAINADLADLQGCRFVSASEPEKGMRFSAARVKYLTGLTEVKARYLRENPFTFQPTHKLFVDANDRPAVADPNDALWNRLKLIPFTVEIPTSEIDTSMGDKLLRERPGIMTWLVGGAMEYFAEGLQDIPEVSAATNEYRQESDRLRDFLADECTVGVGWVAVADLWTAYLDWERRNGVLVPLRKSDFDQRIQRLNCTPTKKHRGTVRAWAGISLRVGTDVTPEPHGGGD